MNGDAYARDGGRHGGREHFSARPGRDDNRDPRERRRRSRSPGPRGPKREPGTDSYSTSRDYREREREDRYRDRREDRDWNRDRGPRRGHEDRPPGGGRDLFADRGDRRGGRDGHPRAGDKRKSPSPPPKPREPTPDLTNIVSVLQRKRRMTQWDMKPPGYENVTAEQAKMSGMFSSPGGPRTAQPMDPAKLQAFMTTTQATVSVSGLKISQSKQSKRLFVSNIPAAATEGSLVEFFNLHLNGLNAVSGLDSCQSAQLADDRSLCLIEFREAEDATVALALDGVPAESAETANGTSNGASTGLVIRRPKDYIGPSADEEEESSALAPRLGPRDGPNKISISNISIYLSEKELNELLIAFGELKSMVLVKDKGTDLSKGIAFCEYVDQSVSAVAVEGLNGMELLEQKLRVQLASSGLAQPSHAEMNVEAIAALAAARSRDHDASRVVQLLNMVTSEDLIDDTEAADIKSDVRDECEKFGTMLELKVPRPMGGARQSNGVGKIYIKFERPESAARAIKALAGRKFADRTVVATYFGEDYFDVGAW